MLNYVVAGVAGASIVVLLEKLLFDKVREKGKLLALRACFGEPVSATKFSFDVVRD